MTSASLQRERDRVAVLVDQANAKREALAGAIEKSKRELNGLIERSKILDSVLEVLTSVADSQREVSKARIERTVTFALRAVFGDAIQFRLGATIKRGAIASRPEIGYRIGKPGKSIAKGTPAIAWVGLDEVGGGVVDVTAFALRVAILSMVRPKPFPVLIADEPFKHVSNKHLPAVASMLRSLADGSGIQFIIVSHEQEIADEADKLYCATKVKGVTTLSDWTTKGSAGLDPQ